MKFTLLASILVLLFSIGCEDDYQVPVDPDVPVDVEPEPIDPPVDIEPVPIDTAVDEPISDPEPFAN